MQDTDQVKNGFVHADVCISDSFPNTSMDGGLFVHTVFGLIGSNSDYSDLFFKTNPNIVFHYTAYSSYNT